ncbi:hypothetical protein Cch01nite_30080 [Cellulomonas chitinilytica]|uniref:Glycosyl hydrolase family 67 C-terminal domain-containing protein n=1 Tax=Cellulomonas chitinilytica TaxID=398759 RepID=A0A919U3L8_9CELL|nr:hypothetical protein [Cellulomonas chitinilytica]GIG22284.1 hypothetical protein Cch01nite_30080 [Cellulomonas chitinilytica]
MPRSRAWPSLVAALVVLALGAAVAVGVGQVLGLSFSPAGTPEAARTGGAPAPAVPPPVIASLDVPAGERVALAASAVRDALADRGLPAPTVTTGTAPADADLAVHVVPAFDPSPEAYRVHRDAAGRYVLDAAGAQGAAAGLYAVADRIRSGAAVVPPGTDGVAQSPRLGLRLTDSGSVGREADEEAFAAGDDYSLNTDVVAGAVLPAAPWVDAAAVARIDAQFRQLVRHALRQGYNGVVVPGFLEYVSFRAVDGVYPAGDPHVERAAAMVEAFGPVFRYAHDMGMHVYLLTDMLAVSPPLEAYLDRTVGGLDVENPALWSVYQAGLSELFDAMPFVDGLMVRIGEGGDVYQAGWDYSSRLAVTTPAAVRTMLRALLDTAGAHDKDLIFRTWTVGVGAVGDLHTDPASYDEVLGDLDDPHLVVSTKYTAGDFYSHLPLNPTLSVGTQRRIVELQARREFEGFGALPNDLVAEHAQALQEFLAANPHVEGIWSWTQDGGPLRAGPMTLYLRTGFWQLYDLNAYGAARLAQDPSASPAQVTADWVRQTLTDDPATVDVVTAALARSREAVTRGLYIGPYAEQSVRALGLEPPPMMWIFEWDIVTGDSAALDSIYAVSRDDLDGSLADGTRAAQVAAAMRDEVAATDPATWRSPELYRSLVDALDYETDLLQTLAAYRATVLRHAQWLDTGSATAHAQWQEAEREYRTARAVHVDRYTGDVALPAYNFTAADLGSERADRDPAMAWLARGLLAATLAALLLGSAAVQRRWRAPGAAALRALLVAVVRPWRLGEVAAPTSRTDRVVVWALPALVLVTSRAVFTWFAAPAHLLATVGAWVLLAVLLRCVVRRRDPFHLWAALGGVVLLRAVVLLVALAVRGPGRYWFAFWTDPTSRTAYVTVAFAAFCWLFVVVALVLRRAYGMRPARALGATAVVGGLTLAVVAGAVAGIGLERALTVWNDQMALLPWGLSRILGITVYLGIPASLPTALAVVGLVVAGTGAAVAVPRPRRAPSAPAGTPEHAVAVHRS